MATNVQEINVLCLLLLVFASLPLIQATNIDCNGKAFHCMNTTHFMICVDIGRGLSSTVDDFLIPCPTNTECRITNKFECEYPPIPPSSSLASTTVEVSDLTTNINQMETSSLSEANNSEYSATVNPITEINESGKSVTTEIIDSLAIGQASIILDLIDPTLSPPMKEDYIESDLKLLITSSENIGVFTTVDPTTVITTSDITVTEPVTHIVEITSTIDESHTHTSQYDPTTISIISAESLKDSIVKDKDNLFVDVFTELSSYGDIEVSTGTSFVSTDSLFATNTDFVTTTETLTSEIYINTETTNTDVMTTTAMDMENTIYSTKGDTVDKSVNETATTVSLVMSSESDFSTDNTEATTDIRMTISEIQDIQNTSPKNTAPSDSNVIDTPTHVTNDFNSINNTETEVIEDSTTIFPPYASPKITHSDYKFLENDFYNSTEAAILIEILTEENAVVTEDNIPNGTTISELPVTNAGESYTELGRDNSNDLTTEYTETVFTTNSLYTILNDNSPLTRTADIPTKNIDVQDTTYKSVTLIDTINRDVIESITVAMDDLNTATESITTQDLTTAATSYALPAVTETVNVPFFTESEVTQTERIMTNKDDRDKNPSLTEGDILQVSNGLSETIISEVPAIIEYNDHTDLGDYDGNDQTTKYGEALFSTISTKENEKSADVTQNPEEIITILTRDTNTPDTFTSNLGLKPTEVLATSASYLFQNHNHDLKGVEHLFTTITTDLELAPESSNNILFEGFQTQISNNNNDAVVTPDTNLLITSIFNEIESATVFLNEVEFNQNSYSKHAKTSENLTLAEPDLLFQNKVEGGIEITEKQTDVPSVTRLNTNIEDITGLTTNSRDFKGNTNKLNDSLRVDENTSTLIVPPQIGVASEAHIGNINYATSTSTIPQINNHELLIEKGKDVLILKIQNSTSNPMATNIIALENVTESVKSTTLSSVINEEININIDERITATKSVLQTENILYDQDKKLINVFHEVTADHSTAPTIIQNLNDYKNNYDIISTENYESVTTQSDMHTTIYESLDYGMKQKTQLNVEKNLGISSKKYISNNIIEKDVAVEVGDVMVSTTVRSNQDIQIDQVRNNIPITTTESILGYDGGFGNSANNIYEEMSTIKSTLSQSIDINIPSTLFITTTDKTNTDIVTIETMEYKSTDYLDHSIKASTTESENKNDILFSSEKKLSLMTNTDNTVRIRQHETETYIRNSTYYTNILSEFTTFGPEIMSVDSEPSLVNLNLTSANNSTLKSDITMKQKDAQILGHRIINNYQNEVTTNKNVFTNIDKDSKKYITHTNTSINEYKEVRENIFYDNIPNNVANNQISNTVTPSSIFEDVLMSTSVNPVHKTVIETMSKPYSGSKIHNFVSSIQNITHRIDTSNETSQISTTTTDEVNELSSYTIASQIITKSVHEKQTINTTKEEQSSSTMTSKLVNTDQKEKVNFDCLYRFRGRYADNENCRRFYICIGKPYPIIGMCPIDTVFSEFRKQCTNNLAHCVRNYVFYCTSEGRFSDIFNNNMYYICVKNNDNKFIRYKLQCENGYYLNKSSIKCTPNAVLKSPSPLLDSDKSQKSSDTSISVTNSNESRKIKKGDDFVCEKEGKIPDPNNCRKYYVCSKNKSSFKKKIKSCDSDEVFDKNKEKCVDAESYEC